MTQILPVIGQIITQPLLIGAALLTWYLSSAVLAWYRLHHIPGPWLASLTELWIIKATYSGRVASIYEELGRKYGPLVRIGPNYILTDDGDFLRRMGAVRGAYQKPDWYVAFRWQPYVDSVFTTRDRIAHDKKKALVGVAYNISGREVDLIEPNVDNQILEMLELVRRKYIPNKAVERPPYLEFGDFSSYLTMDIVTRAAFGREFGHLKTDSDVTGFLTEIRSVWPIQGLVSEWTTLRSLLYSRAYLNLFGPKPTDKSGAGRLMSVVVNCVKERFQTTEPQVQKDMLGSWMHHGLSQGECEAEGLLAIIAGSETTASVMRITMLSLVSSPAIYQKFKDVIRETVHNGAISHPITYDQAKEIPYLRSVVYEGLRMRPGTTGAFPKIVPPQGETIHGQFIPGGTVVAMNISSLLRSQKIFGDDPDLYRPERWLEVGHAKRVDMEREVEMMFGSGRWMCAGKPIAFMELHKTFFELFRYFDFQIASPIKPCTSKSYTVYIEQDMLLRVTKAVE